MKAFFEWEDFWSYWDSLDYSEKVIVAPVITGLRFVVDDHSDLTFIASDLWVIPCEQDTKSFVFRLEWVPEE